MLLSDMAHQPPISTISQNYKMFKVLGQGCYGQVIKCLKQDTDETVAVKVLKQRHSQLKIIREVTTNVNLFVTLREKSDDCQH
uniref:Protein kinase domain-containing protein n=1 Tax=Seriola lalandi dorsalis TaxID=1841481 RepID=A0A3B4WY15_SERLL